MDGTVTEVHLVPHRPSSVNMVCKVVLITLLAGVALAVPQYDYQRPQPPPPPTGLYLPPTAAPPLRPPVAPPRALPRPPPQTYKIPQATNNRPQTYQPPPSPGMEGMPYDFEWGVQDQGTGNAFSHVENSDGRTTQGEYRVLLPDGRTQVVTFYDNGGGFNADVTYV